MPWLNACMQEKSLNIHLKVRQSHKFADVLCLVHGVFVFIVDHIKVSTLANLMGEALRICTNLFNGPEWGISTLTIEIMLGAFWFLNSFSKCPAD